MGKILDIITFGDCCDTMRRWAADGVRAQTCVTSPPYFGLRDYGHPGQIGLEKTPEEYIAAMVEVFRCVKDVLADDGTLWLNIGDSYVGAMSQHKDSGSFGETSCISKKTKSGIPQTGRVERNRLLRENGLKQKDLIGIPWLLAFALRADGWYLRQDIIWHKPNPMPESVRDRCTKAHEYIFLLSKSERYFFDSEAIKEPAVTKENRPAGIVRDRVFQYDSKQAEPRKQRSKRDTFKRDNSKREQPIPGQDYGTHRPDREESSYDTDTRNRRSVWTVATRPYKGAHFATFPPALIEPCILAGSRPGDIVLDPFMGSGTTAAVSVQHGRHYLGCELNPEYGDLKRERIDAVSASRHQLGLNLEAV